MQNQALSHVLSAKHTQPMDMGNQWLKSALHPAHLQVWSDIFAGHGSSCTPLVKIPSLLLDQHWLPASQCKAQLGKFKSLSICSIRDTLQQLLSPKEKGKPALQFFSSPFYYLKRERFSWGKIKPRAPVLQQSALHRQATNSTELTLQRNKWFTGLHVSRLHLRFQQKLDVKLRLMTVAAPFPRNTIPIQLVRKTKPLPKTSTPTTTPAEQANTWRDGQKSSTSWLLELSMQEEHQYSPV